MRVKEEITQFLPDGDMLLSIGVFDGVHLGHRHLISRLVSLAKQQDRLSGVITFKEHPRKLLAPLTYLPYLSTPAERERLLKQEGVDAVITLSFTPELARLSARDFISLLIKYLRMRGLVVGPDFALGKDREGTIEVLSSLGKEMGFTITVVTPRRVNREIVSSTAIRRALAEGNMPKVTSLLGRPFSLQGKVTTGDRRGTGLGFPTANIAVDSKQAIPPDGVYATWAYIGSQQYQAMTNIGTRPTFGNNERTIESFILNYDQNLYGQELKIEIIERLRGEKQFNSIDELKKQITEDVKQGQQILARSQQ